MPAIEISQEHYDRLMAFKPVVEQTIHESMSDSEFTDFIAFWAVEQLLLQSMMSADFQLVESLRKGDSVVQAVIDVLRNAQLTIEGLSRRYPNEVFTFVADVWKHMNSDERQDKGIGFHVLWERYQQTKTEQP